VNARRVERLGDQTFWPKVEIAVEVGAPLCRRPVGHKRKNRIKEYLECGSGKKASGKETEKVKKLICGKFKCLKCGEFGHRKTASNDPLMVQRKSKCLIAAPNVMYFQHDYYSD
jgi:hypothetical protein